MCLVCPDKMNSAFFHRVMVVAHPDDEALWGGKALGQEDGWLVICLTLGTDTVRAEKFKRVMDMFNVKREIWDYPANWEAASADMMDEIKMRLAPIVNAPSVSKVVTHNPDGEYGHRDHQIISQMITALIDKKENLYYFNFAAPPAKLSALKRRAFNIYWSGFLPEHKWLRPLWRIFRPHLEKTNHALIRAHNELSQYEKIVSYSEYRYCGDLLFNIYQFVPGFLLAPAVSIEITNSASVYNGNRSFYEKYPDRKYMITEFLPACTGKTLSVGCHAFNRYDCHCLPNPNDYETIDIDEKWRKYGSPYKHTNVDFLDYSPEYRFSHIVLFGVMGISPTDGGGDAYSLYNRDEETVKKADALLCIGGRVLFGPDLRTAKTKLKIRKRLWKARKLAYWKKNFANNEILKKKYTFVLEIESPESYIAVFQKKA